MPSEETDIYNQNIEFTKHRLHRTLMRNSNCTYKNPEDTCNNVSWQHPSYVQTSCNIQVVNNKY